MFYVSNQIKDVDFTVCGYTENQLTHRIRFIPKIRFVIVITLTINWSITFYYVLFS